MQTCKCGWLHRLVAAALALLLTLGLGVTALAEGSGYTPTNGYVLRLSSSTDPVWQYAQFSRIAPDAYYAGQEIEGESIVFGLSYNGVGFESLYCTDLPVAAYGNIYYRPLNLSDSTYAAGMANRLRGVLLKTYPHISVDALRTASGIPELTRSEAITGSQMAIWKLAHGDAVTFSDAVHYVSANYRNSEIQNQLNSEGTAFQNADDAGKAAVNARIWALYDYLLNLPAMAPAKPVVSEASFLSKSAVPTVTDNGDGTCNITVETTVAVQIDSGDRLTLTAHMADGAYFVSKPLGSGTSSHTLTIPNVPADRASGSVTLAIDGVQKMNDVYLIDAQGIRGERQSLIGVLDQTLPVHAETLAQPDRVLNIVKTDGGGQGLSGIAFNVYYVGSMADYLSGALRIGSRPTDADISRYAQNSLLVGTLTTDASGRASLNFGTADGVYLVKELPHTDVEAVIRPFFVCLPDYSRGDPAYTITAYPKNNVVSDKPTIEKDVTEIGNKSDTCAVGQDHQWIIRTSIPRGMADGKSYVITDTLDHRLRYRQLDRVELVQTAETDPAGTVVLTLTKDTDYILTVDTATDAENHAVDRFTVALTAAGIRKVARAAGNAPADFELRTWFTAQINQNAQMGTAIPNQAHIDYTNSVGKTFRVDSDQPEVHTGGAQLKKVDAADESRTLAGATFAVYRMALPDEIAADTENSLPRFQIGETTYTMVQVAFYDNTALTGHTTMTVTTGADGKAVIYGLAYGDYYLVETKAPDGYRLLPQPTKFVVNESSHQDTAVLTIANSGGVELPTTGGAGTMIFTALGTAMVCAAAVLLVTKRRMRS